MLLSRQSLLTHRCCCCCCCCCPAGPKELFASSDTVIVPTASAPYKVQVAKTADGVTVTDYQGNVAKVTSADLGSGNHRVHAIDKVLFSGESNTRSNLG
jgi:hypothetical protein